jgi:hypothetical protein
MPGVALVLLAVEVKWIVTADLDVARDRSVERRNLKAGTPALAPIANGLQGPFDKTIRAPRPR